MLAIQKQNQQKNIEKEPLFNFQSIDEYLHGLVKSKSIFSLCLLVLINCGGIYSIWCYIKNLVEGYSDSVEINH